MNIFEKFLNNISYKFPKGYPDMNNEQDISLLESLVSEILGENINLIEMANLAGAATGYPGSLGAFKKYVLENPKSENMDFEVDKDAYIYDTNLDQLLNVKKGEKFKITAKTDSDLLVSKNSYFAPINYNGKEAYIRISDIRKPTGKSVETLDVNTSNKKEGVFFGFTPGHPQEGKVVELFIQDSNDNWIFNYQNTEAQIKYLGEPQWKGKGKPKTDVQIILNKTLRKDIGNDLKVSLKAGNAEFVENWVIPSRAIQILGKENLKQEVTRIYNLLINDKLFKKGTSAKNIALFIGTKPNSYPDAYKLTPEQKYEAYTGVEKFGENNPAVANCYFKGEVPNTIQDFIKKLVPLNYNTVNNDLEDLYLYVRGSNESRGSSFFISKDNDSWYITPQWIEALGI
jgi:hypothetical protein